MCTAGLNQQIICKYIVYLIKIPMHLEKNYSNTGGRGAQIEPSSGTQR